HWVQREIDYWLRNNSIKKLLIILTDGELVWDSLIGDFDWSRTTALPPNLRQRFTEEPLYLDLRWVVATEHLSLTHPTFREAIAGLAATLHGREKDELSGEEVRQHRQALRLAWSAVITLVFLTAGAVGAAWYAWTERQQARQELRDSKLNQAIANRW